MLKERFIKVNGNVYYESELQMMSDRQLRGLINECEKGIAEIQRKSDDYRNSNYDTPDIVHYQDVLNKFESASIYLQSDIVLLEKILKSSKQSDNTDSEYIWYRTYFEESSKGILNKKWRKTVEKVNKKLGYSINLTC